GQIGPYANDTTGKLFFQGGKPGENIPTAGVDPTITVYTSGTATASRQSLDLGISLKPIILKGGTEGGPQSVNDLTSISIGANGVITGFHSVHGMIELGRIDLATFPNTQGLQQAGNTYFTTSPNSGSSILATPGSNGCGILKSSSLEMSNVDLSNEFSDMITTQRGFQANSRLITVSDTMLEELINLKR
ncbi:MAG: flagellar hook-basal body complex protein, partial [Oscillospiraceae bacterium]